MAVDPSARKAGAARSDVAPATPLTTPPAISLRIAAITWLTGWLVGNIGGIAVISVAGYSGKKEGTFPVWLEAASVLALWAPQIAALVVVSYRCATGHPFTDYSFAFRPIDLVGIPIGVLSQLVLLRLVYWPLQSGWPGTFSSKHLEQNAHDLYDKAHGFWLVVLVAVIVVGAPLVEESVYRGLLQGAARRRLNDVIAVVLVAAFFALIHFRPVEYPGLFAFGLVVGFCAFSTNRLGMGIVTHMAFNATALALVAH